MMTHRFIVQQLVLVFAICLMSCGSEDGSTSTNDSSTKDSSTSMELKDDSDAGQSTAEEKDTSEPATGEADGSVEQDSKDTAESPDSVSSVISKLNSLKALAAELQERREYLDLRERELNRREQLIETLEVAAFSKAGELNKLKEEATALLNGMQGKLKTERQERVKEFKVAVDDLSKEREVRIAHLVSTINGMRAAAGAGLLGSMGQDDAVEVLRQLSAKQAAVFLGAMPPQKAAQLAEAMLGPKIPNTGILDEAPETETAEGPE